MAPSSASFVKRELNESGVLAAVIVLAVLASTCTVILIIFLIFDWYSAARRRSKGAKPHRPVSEGSFWSPDARIQSGMSESTLERKGDPFRDESRDPSPPRPDRPPQPWGETASHRPVPPTKFTPKPRLSPSSLRSSSTRRSRSSTHSKRSLVTIRSFIQPAVRALAAPEKALVRDRALELPPANESGDGYRPLSRRAPFKKPHPFPVSIRRPPGPTGEEPPGV